mmetsp:Transcript_30456/g.30971  ORF Transcript_30456/g.30971 Transcript_30456/m.30971 type:complete len:93 (-) Transcript_30456:150-428(-)
MSSTASLSRSSAYNSSLRRNVVDVTDRIIVDPRAKGLLWHEAYRQNLRAQREIRKDEAEVRRIRQREQEAGREVQGNISQFEEKLKSMNRYH